MQAILVKYYGPTNTRGTRLTARAEAGSVTLQREYALNVDEDARRVAAALCSTFGWNADNLVGGGLPNGDRVFVFAGGTAR
jgi:hypothetical protein